MCAGPCRQPARGYPVAPMRDDLERSCFDHPPRSDVSLPEGWIEMCVLPLTLARDRHLALEIHADDDSNTRGVGRRFDDRVLGRRRRLAGGKQYTQDGKSDDPIHDVRLQGEVKLGLQYIIFKLFCQYKKAPI